MNRLEVMAQFGLTRNPDIFQRYDTIAGQQGPFILGNFLRFFRSLTPARSGRNQKSPIFPKIVVGVWCQAASGRKAIGGLPVAGPVFDVNCISRLLWFDNQVWDRVPFLCFLIYFCFKPSQCLIQFPND